MADLEKVSRQPLAAVDERLNCFALNPKIQRRSELIKLCRAECAEREHIEWTRRNREMDHIQLSYYEPGDNIVLWRPESVWELEDEELYQQIHRLTVELTEEFKKSFTDVFHYYIRRVSKDFIDKFMKKNNWCTHKPERFPEIEALIKQCHLRPYDILVLEANFADELYAPPGENENPRPLIRYPNEMDWTSNDHLVVFNHPDGQVFDWDDRGAHVSQGFTADFFARFGLDIWSVNQVYHSFKNTCVYGFEIKDQLTAISLLRQLEPLQNEKYWSDLLSAKLNTRVAFKDFLLFILPEFVEVSWIIASPKIELDRLYRKDEKEITAFNTFLSSKGITEKTNYYRLGFAF